jgi:hypothetical protein
MSTDQDNPASDRKQHAKTPVWRSSDRVVVLAVDAMELADKTGSDSLTCGWCSRLVQSPKLMGNLLWCRDCCDKLGICPSCRSQSYCSDSSTEVKSERRTYNWYYTCHGCVKCGFQKTYVVCHGCKLHKEYAKISDGVVTCDGCQLAAEKKRAADEEAWNRSSQFVDTPN